MLGTLTLPHATRASKDRRRDTTWRMLSRKRPSTAANTPLRGRFQPDMGQIWADPDARFRSNLSGADTGSDLVTGRVTGMMQGAVGHVGDLQVSAAPRFRGKSSFDRMAVDTAVLMY